MGISKLGPGRYRVFVDRGRDPDGRRSQHTEVVRGTKKDAEAREAEIRRRLNSGSYVEPSRMTVAEYMAMWVESVQHQVERNTYRGYEQRTGTHIVPDLGSVPLQKLSPIQIQRAETDWLKRGNRRNGGPLDPQTVLHIHRCLHRAMGQAVRWRLISVNPVDGVEPPAVPHREQGYLTPEESERVVAVLVGDLYELPILVGLYCGLRPTEYLGLRWRDVDLDAGELRVTQNVHRMRQDESSSHMGHEVYGFWFDDAKTHRSKRPVSMPGEVADLLREWRPQQAALRLKAGPSWTDLDLVFTDARGYPHNHDRVRRSFYRALEAAEVRKVVLYALRHTMATIALNRSKDLKLVAARLGHANEMLVLRTYGHLLPGLDRRLSDELGEAIRRPPRPRSEGEGKEAERE